MRLSNTYSCVMLYGGVVRIYEVSKQQFLHRHLLLGGAYDLGSVSHY